MSKISCCSHLIIAGGHDGGKPEIVMSGDSINTLIERMFNLMEQNYRTELPPNIMVTFIGSERLECVQTNRCKKFYREGDKIEYKSSELKPKILDAYKSVGDDIEDFFQRNKKELTTANDKKPSSLELSTSLSVKSYVFLH